MSWFLVCARVLLGGVFVVAAIGKLADRRGSLEALGAFGVPPGLARPGAVVLPLLETAVAATLILAPTARAGSVGALVLLAGFTVAIAGAVRRGQQMECHCFGALHSEPVGIIPGVRNLALGAAAAVVATQATQPAIDGWFTERSADQLAILAVSATLVASLLAAAMLWRQNRALRTPRAVPEPPRPLALGTRAPAFRLPDLDHRPVRLKALLNACDRAVLVFLSPGCGSCQAILPDLSRWQVPLSRNLPIYVISAGEVERTRAMAGEHELDHVLVDPRRAVADRYGIRATPAALIVDGDGRIGSAPATGPAAIEALIRRALCDSSAVRRNAQGSARRHEQRLGRPADPPALVE